MGNQENIRLFSMEKETLRFLYLKEKSLQKEIVLDIGYENISKTYFHHAIPTEDEVEYAINKIEDELMSNKELINNKENLVCRDKLLAEILLKNDEQKNLYTRQNIEDLFTKYAYLSMGEPLSRSKIRITPEDFAIILLLREIMHHLKFNEFRII